MKFKALFTVILAVFSYCSHAQSKDSIFNIVDNQAYNNNWLEYLNQNLKYPKTAIQNNIQGRIIVKFVVEKDGSVSNATIIRGKDLGNGLPEEALRVVNGSSKWIPAKQDGHIVRSLKTMPITFKLEEDAKEINTVPNDNAGLSNILYTVQSKPEPKIESRPDENHIYRSVQQIASPSFNLAQYLNNKLKYPKEAHENGVQGKIIVQFVIEKDGSISNVTIIRGKELGKAFSEEAIRVIKSMPKWNPAKQNGKIVRSYYTQPIVFSQN